MNRHRIALSLCALLAALPAAHADEPVPSVQVKGITDPEMRSYRHVAAGLDAFDAHRALAPHALLRFRMRHKNGAPATAADGLQLRLANDDGSFQEHVPIDGEGLLTVARNPAAYDAVATFILNSGTTAILRDGARTRTLETHGWDVMVPIGDTGWSDDALVQFDEDAPGSTTRTADGTPRTAP
jgi:hypothetical protein